MKTINPYSEEYFNEQLKKYNNVIQTFYRGEAGRMRTEQNRHSFKTANITLKYEDEVFTRLDGYMYDDLRQWSNFPVLEENGNLWMSVTPLEITSQYTPIKLSEGDVGVAGLGLGYFMQNILNKPAVKSVTVYEINKNIIKLYEENFGKHPKLNIKNKNVLEVEGKSFDFFYTDIYQELLPKSVVTDMYKIIRQNTIESYFFWGLEAMFIEFIQNNRDLKVLPNDYFLTWQEVSSDLIQYFIESDYWNYYKRYSCQQLYEEFQKRNM